MNIIKQLTESDFSQMIIDMFIWTEVVSWKVLSTSSVWSKPRHFLLISKTKASEN